MKPSEAETIKQEESEQTEAKASDIPVETMNKINVDNDIIDPQKVEEKQRMIFTIQKYQDSPRFSDIVRNELKITQNYSQLSEMPMIDLENILSRIRIHLDNKNLNKFYDNIATTTAITYETAISQFYNIDGFSDMLLDNDEFWNIFERYKCEYQLPAVNPTMQLLFIIAQTTFMAHHLGASRSSSDIEYEMQGPSPSAELLIQDLETIAEEPTPIQNTATKQKTESAGTEQKTESAGTEQIQQHNIGSAI